MKPSSFHVLQWLVDTGPGTLLYHLGLMLVEMSFRGAGVCLLARKDVRATHQCGSSTEFGEFLAVDFCTFMVINVYQRPRTAATGMHSELHDVVTAQQHGFSYYYDG